MADSLEARLIAHFNATLTNTLTDTNVTSATVDKKATVTFTDGTTSGKSDKVWYSGVRTLTGSTNEDLDVFDFTGLDLGPGAAEDPLGNSVSFAEITGLMVVNASSSTGNLTLGGEGSTDAWESPFNSSQTAAVGPFGPGGGCLLWRTDDPAWAVSNGNHKLRVGSSATLTYGVYIVGRSA